MNIQPTLGFVLHDVARLMRKRFEQRARQIGLTRSQWQVLSKLATNEGIHQRGLAALLEIEPITLVRILDKMQERGLVERRPHASDRRMTLLYLTTESLPLLKVMRLFGEQTSVEALANFSEAESMQLHVALDRMRENLLFYCSQPTENEGSDNV